MASGFVGGWLDLAIGRVMDVLFSFPTLILAIGSRGDARAGLDNAVLAIAVVYAPLFSRVARGPVSPSVRRITWWPPGLGAGPLRILFRHVLPNVLAPLIVQASVGLAFAILTEASLSYVGLGTQPPDPSVGHDAQRGPDLSRDGAVDERLSGPRDHARGAGFNLLGDGLRDVLDPQLRGR